MKRNVCHALRIGIIEKKSWEIRFAALNGIQTAFDFLLYSLSLTLFKRQRYIVLEGSIFSLHMAFTSTSFALPTVKYDSDKIWEIIMLSLGENKYI